MLRSTSTSNILNIEKRLLRILLPSLLIAAVHCTGDLGDESESRDAQARNVVLTLSPVHLMYLAEQESEIFNHMRELQNLTDSEEQRRLIKIWLTDYRDSTLKGTVHSQEVLNTKRSSAELVVAHPLMVLRMLRRYAKILPSLLCCNSSKDAHAQTVLARKVEELKILGTLPTMTNLQYAKSGIIRISEVYGLNPYSIIGGKIGKLKTRVGLTLEQALEIALEAIEEGNMEFASDWLDAVNDIKNENEDSAALSRLIDELVTKLEGAHETNDEEGSITRDEDPMYVFPITENFRIQNMNQSQITPTENSNSEGFTYDVDTLCNGITLTTQSERSKLHCWYERKQDFTWLISPLKMELVNARINLVLIHEAIGDILINEIIDSYKGCMERFRSKHQNDKNKTGNSNDDYLGESTCRLKYQVWQSKLDSKIKKMLGVQVVNAEEFGGSEFAQVTSASVGGHVIPHIDAFTGKVDTSDGIRFVSLLIYMNDVELGGHLVFPELGTGVVPQKGLAVFWHNYITDTRETNSLTVHTGCPILYGEKWFIKYAKPFRPANV